MTLNNRQLFSGQRGAVGFWFALLLALWGAAVLAAGRFGLLSRFPLLAIPPMVVCGVVLPVLAYYAYRPFRAFISTCDLRALTLFHVWRIPAALTFFAYGSHHLLPPRFVFNAGWGDLIVGLLAPIVQVLPASRRSYLTFHLFGLADFVVAVGTGLLFTLLRVPLMENITTFPVVLIPLYGVCVTGALSIMTLDRLVRGRRAEHLLEETP